MENLSPIQIPGTQENLHVSSKQEQAALTKLFHTSATLNKGESDLVKRAVEKKNEHISEPGFRKVNDFFQGRLTEK